MPTYDYQCDSCGHTFETMQSMKDAPLSVCPECENASLRRLISGGTGVIFKGSGFYVNDSRKSSSAGSSSTAKKTSSEDSGSGTTESTSGTDTAKTGKTDSSKKSA
ncbi:MAG: zinc ribbon domain-containing protein [Alkalispirochaeta sp.]